MKRKQLGFTLIEVLVALAVIAVALAAGVQASGALLANTERQRESVLNQLPRQMRHQWRGAGLPTGTRSTRPKTWLRGLCRAFKAD